MNYPFPVVDERSECLALLREQGIPTGFGHWWDERPKRALEEICKMLDNTNARHVVDGCNLYWLETITTKYGRTYEIVIQTGPGYPHTMPRAYVPGVPPTKHMWNDNALCLFKQDLYSSSMSILDIRNHACSWCHARDVYLATGVWGAAEASHLF